MLPVPMNAYFMNISFIIQKSGANRSFMLYFMGFIVGTKESDFA
jgi:hypothetical protein